MIKWHIKLNERTGTMKKKKSVLPELPIHHKGDAVPKENRRSKNYAAIASINRKWHKLIRKHETLVALLAGSHFLYSIKTIV